MYTESHLDRISKGRRVLNKIILRLDHHINYQPPVAQSKHQIKVKDLKLLTDKLKAEDLLEVGPQRTHSASLTNISANPAAGVNGKSLRRWLSERIQMCQVRHYYQQFVPIPPSQLDDSASNDHPFLSDPVWTEMEL